jgi:hypothetical protein
MGTYKIHPQPGDTPIVTMDGDFSMDELSVILEEMENIYVDSDEEPEPGELAGKGER